MHSQIQMKVRYLSEIQAIKDTMSKNPDQPTLMLQTSTWYRDNQGLYDYQANNSHLVFDKMCISQQCMIYRQLTTNKIVCLREEDRDKKKPTMQYIYIASILYSKNNRQYTIQSADQSGIRPHGYISQENPDYFRNSCISISGFYKDAGQEGYPLEVGNFIRLGKLQFQVIQVNDAYGKKCTKQTSHLQKNKGVYIVEQEQSQKGTCKFCLCEQASEKDPLISPCNCSGSCELVHVYCLRSWINSKVRKEVNNQGLSYNFSKFQCEICKVLFPKAVRLLDQTEVTMLDYQKSTKPYVILQSSGHNKTDPTERVVYVLFPQQNQPVKLGRGHNCGFRLDDVTVSRLHAQVRLSNGKFYISDKQSKFGTLVKFREQLPIKQKLKIQSGRMLLTFSLKNENTPQIFQRIDRCLATRRHQKNQKIR